MARKPKKKQLFDIQLHELSLVDEPANAEAQVTLFKRADGAPPEGDQDMVDTTKAVDELAKKLDAVVGKMDTAAKNNEELTKQLEASRAKVAELETAAELEKAAKNDDAADDLFKGLDPKAAEMVRSALAKAEKSEKDLNKMKEERLTAAFISKAKDLNHLPIDAETLGPILKRMSLGQVGDEDFDAVNKMLAGINEVLKTSEVFKTIGNGMPILKSGAEAELDALASELMKSNTSLTREGAFSKAMEQRPELYAQYLRESSTVN